MFFGIPQGDTARGEPVDGRHSWNETVQISCPGVLQIMTWKANLCRLAGYVRARGGSPWWS